MDINFDVIDGITDEKGRILRLLLQLAHSVPDEEYSRENVLGRKVFKPPIVFTNNVSTCSLMVFIPTIVIETA